jgi:hypothetical protein
VFFNYAASIKTDSSQVRSMQLYHGSSKPLLGEELEPSQAYDHPDRPENNQLAVYATDRRDLAIVMAMISANGGNGSIDEYSEGKLNARLYGGYPKQEFLYLHQLATDTFTQTQIDSHQYVSLVAVRVVKTEKIRVSEYHHLARIANPEETKAYVAKYGPLD